MVTEEVFKNSTSHYIFWKDVYIHAIQAGILICCYNINCLLKFFAFTRKERTLFCLQCLCLWTTCLKLAETGAWEYWVPDKCQRFVLSHLLCLLLLMWFQLCWSSVNAVWLWQGSPLCRQQYNVVSLIEKHNVLASSWIYCIYLYVVLEYLVYWTNEIL